MKCSAFRKQCWAWAAGLAITLCATTAFAAAERKAVDDGNGTANQPSEQKAVPSLVAVRLAPGEHISMDGRIDHPAWNRAPMFDGFVQKEPVFGVAPRYVTRVQLLYDDVSLYVGVSSIDDNPEQIRAPLVRRDGVDRTQDHVFVYVDAIGKRQSAQFFRVNAGGSIGDGIHIAAGDDEDIAPDFDFDAASARTSSGYTSVFRIPFSSLRFPSGVQTGWRIMVGRRIPREQFYLVTSVAIPLDASAFISAMQPLHGFEVREQNHPVMLRPTVTIKQASTLDPWQNRASSARVGLDAKWRPVPELVVDATFRPDFSQVELDIPQLSGNTSFALSLPEKRPFFFESADLLRSPTEALYTRSVSAPVWGLRATWRGAAMSGTAFVVDDNGGGLTLLPDAYGTQTARQPRSRALSARLRGDIADVPSLELGGVVAARHYEANHGGNLVIGPDLIWQLSDAWRLRGQWLRSETTALPDGSGNLRRQGTQRGNSAFLKVVRQTERLNSEMTIVNIEPNFRNDTGFVSQAGIRTVKLHQGIAFRDVAPINQLWINLDATQSRDWSDGALVQQAFTSGVWLSAPGNTEWTLEYHGHSRLRTERGGLLLQERYWYTEFSTTPGVRIPKLTASLSLGRLTDYAAGIVRPGGQLKATLAGRPVSSLEFEPSWSLAWLRSDSIFNYRESAAQLLSIWHIDAKQNLRTILQRTRNERRVDVNAVLAHEMSGAASFTYSYRYSTSTVLYLGVTGTRSSTQTGTRARANELFFKLQAGFDEAKSLVKSR
jgi:Domain of unknown function (DUF5916)